MFSVERKWWFYLPLMVLACLSTLFLFRSAQVPSTGSLAYFLIFCLVLCLFAPLAVIPDVAVAVMAGTQAGGPSHRRQMTARRWQTTSPENNLS